MQKIDTELDPVRGNIYDRNKNSSDSHKGELGGHSLTYTRKGLDSSAEREESTRFI